MITKIFSNTGDRWSPLVLSMGALLVFAGLFGGASRLHEVRLALVELAALPLLVVVASQLLNDGPRPTAFATGLLLALAALPLIQLIPLPPGAWTALPGRDQPALALTLAGANAGWLPISLTPDKTWRSFLALLPPLTIFFAAGLCRPDIRARTIQALLCFAAGSVLLGAAQLASGSDRLYLWATTDPGNVVGFFANRNHLATLCLMMMPFAAVLGAKVLRRSRSESRLPLWLSIFFIALMVVSLGVIRSRMGVILLGPTIAVSMLAAWVASGRGRPKPLLLGLAGGTALALIAVGVFALGPILARFDTNGAPEGRFENWPVVFEASAQYLPVGSGIGSFDPVFRSVEPLERLDATFFNQAHNEYLEVWLETGWMGGALVFVFLVWFFRRSWTAWKAEPSSERDLQRAATIAIGVVLIHSVVDYPLRTETIATIFAFCCGILELASRTTGVLASESSSRRRRSRSY